MLSLPMAEFTTTGFYFSLFMFVTAELLLLIFYFIRWPSDRTSFLVWSSAYILVGAWVWPFTQDITSIISVIGINCVLLFALRRLIVTTSLFGVFFLISLMMPSVFGIIWFIELIHFINQSLTNGFFSALLWSGAILFIFLAIANTAMWCWIVLARYSKLYFRFFRLRRACKEADQVSSVQPWVSIHVPCYSEPPGIVIDTLNALASLQYTNFEVLVIDNNTQDPNLWKPLEEQCKKLGDHFRFYHYDHLEGAKAGALNAALRLTAPQVQIISVIDADYIVEPYFLKKLVKFLDDPKVGFVQSCQDYHSWKKSHYLSACYYEYQTHFKLELPGQNEWDVNYTIGTMCLIRRKALEEAGGWAEWCLTEDSEVAVRIHTLGYTGYYLKSTFGYGLIPETFESYKQQRFRWSAGPVQQFQRHWRLYLPWHRSGLTQIQKIGEIFHSLSTFFSEGLNFIFNIPILAFCLWMKIAYQQSFVLPTVILWLIPIAIIQNMIGNWIHIRLLGGKWKDSILSSIAARSLVYTRNMAFYKACFSKHLSWKRTDKFKTNSNLSRAFSSSKEEIIMGCVYIIIATALFPIVSFRQPDIIFLIWLNIVNQIFSFFCAPIMALLSEKELGKKKENIKPMTELKFSSNGES